MSRHSPSLPLELDEGASITIGGHPVICSCADGTAESDKMVVKEIYVSRSTGKLVIVYDDGVIPE